MEEWSRVEYKIGKRKLCKKEAVCDSELLHIAHLFFTRRDMMFTIRGRWRNGGDGHVDSFRHSRSVASIGSGVLTHFLHDDHGLSNHKSFRLALELV